MYQPSHFDESRTELLHALVHDHPLATLITLDQAGALQADPLPMLLETGPAGERWLRGHVARANPLWRATRPEVPVLAVFQGPQAYVSPAWYASKAEHGKVVPTWNYMVVQARGPLRVVDDPGWLHALVSRLTARHESARTPAGQTPWHVDDAPADYVAAMLRAIVGIEIEVSALTGKWKLSQNRHAADRAGVVAGLEAHAASAPGAGLVARAMDSGA